MKNYLVKDLMVPISEYAAVRTGTSLHDAILALEKAQETYTSSKYHHRAILVLDENNNVIGKISQLRALRAIDREYDYTDEIDLIKKHKFTDTYISHLRQQYRSNGQVLNTDTLRLAAGKKVEEFMQTPSAGEIVSEDSDLDTAIHKLVAGTHLSLLVTRDDKVVGILRISDVFAATFHEMSATLGT